MTKVSAYFTITSHFSASAGTYQSENEVHTTDELDFRHHNYKDMRQVCFKSNSFQMMYNQINFTRVCLLASHFTDDEGDT